MQENNGMDTMKKMDEKKPSVNFIVTMDIAYKQLEKGILSIEEYERFLDMMYQKYQDDYTRILYTSKLTVYKDNLK